MSTPNKAKIAAIRTYLLNAVDETLQNENKMNAAAGEFKHKTLLTKVKAAHKKMTAAEKEYSAALSQLRDAVAPLKLGVSTPSSSFSSTNSKEIMLVPASNHNTYASLHGSGVYKSYSCTPEQMNKAREAVKQIDNYCLELVISPDMENLENFAKQLLKTLK